jgi:hypothetical protein
MRSRLAQGLVRKRILAGSLIAVQAIGIGFVGAESQGETEQRALSTDSDVLRCAFQGAYELDELPAADDVWFVRGIVVPSADAEWQYTVRKAARSSSEVELLQIQGGRLLGRPETAAAKRCADVLSFVKVARYVSTADVCPALHESVSEFEHLALPAVPDASLRIHASQYEITAGTALGDQFRWRVDGRPGERGSAHPLVDWSEDLRRAVEECSRNEADD